MLFSGSFWQVCVMAASLEIGKLVAASFVYQYWKIVNWLQKSYMIAAIITLIGKQVWVILAIYQIHIWELL